MWVKKLRLNRGSLECLQIISFTILYAHHIVPLSHSVCSECDLEGEKE